MLVHNGLICNECDATEDSVFYTRAGGPPECPACGGDRRVWWGHGEAPRLHSDEKGGLDIGATPDTREYELSQTRSGIKQLRAELEAQYPGKRIEFEPPNKKRLMEAEERQHEVWRRRKERGVDMKTFEETKRAKRVAAADAKAKAEALGADNKQRKALVKEKVTRVVESG